MLGEGSGVRALSESKASPDDDRIQRLVGLARVWSQTALYHPSRTTPDPEWEAVLTGAIAAVEAATTAAAYVAALNEALLRHLDDPLSYATLAPAPQPAERSRAADSGSLASVLPSEVGVLQSSDVRSYADPGYLTRVAEAVKQLADAPGIILDLRWGEAPSQMPWPGALGLFLEEPLPTPGALMRVHHGWNEGAESVYWAELSVRQGPPLTPLKAPTWYLMRQYPETRFADLPTFRGRLTVLVDDISVARLDDALAALQAAGRAVIVHETDGRVRSTDEPLRLWGDVEVWLRLYRQVGTSAWADLQPDLVLPADTERGRALHEAAALLLSDVAAPQAGPPLTFPARLPSSPPAADGGELSREERVLGLIKVWAVLRDFFPHLEFADLDWSTLLPDWLPRVEAATTTAGYYGVLMELAARLNDSHVSVNHPTLAARIGTHRPPLDLRPIEGRMVVTAAADDAAAAGIRMGMVITTVDGRPAGEIIDERSALIASSTPQARMWALANQFLLGAEGTAVQLAVDGGDTPRTFSLKRSLPRWSPLPNAVAEPARRVDVFGYIDLTSVPTVEAFNDALRSLLDAPGLILDMRGYPRFFVQFDVVKTLIETPCISTQFQVPVRSAYDRRSLQVSTYEVQPSSSLHYTAPVVVLIDERAVSAAEDFCIYLRNARRVTFVGSPTAGTNGNVTVVRLPGGGSLSFTGMRVLHGDGSRFQNIGILPEVVTAPTIAGVRAGRDEVLEAGIATLRGLTGAPPEP